MAKAGWVILAIMGVLILGIAVYWYSTKDAQTYTSPSKDTSSQPTAQTQPIVEQTPPATTSSQGKTVSVDILNFQFSPQTSTINTGDTITWTNKDSTAHSATANDGSFDSKRISSDGKYSFTFTKAGTYTYYCTYHPGMKATIIVQ